jgi:hypothetical protein
MQGALCAPKPRLESLGYRATRGSEWLFVKNARVLLKLEKKENSMPKYYAMSATLMQSGLESGRCIMRMIRQSLCGD